MAHGVSAAELGPTPPTAFFPRSFAGNDSFPFSIPSGFEEPGYLYYVAVDARTPSTVRVVAEDGGLLDQWQVEWEQVSLVQIDRPGDYRIEARGEGTVLVFAMPFTLQNTNAFSGALPAGVFTFGFSRGMWGGHPHVEIGFTAAASVTAYLYVLHDELAPVAGTEVGTSGTFVQESSRFDFFFLVVYNPQTEPVAASVHVLGFGEWPLGPGAYVPVVVLALGASLAVFFAWRSRRRAVPRQ